MFKVTTDNLNLITQFEGLTLQPLHEHPDRIGIVTIGYGTIQYPPYYMEGKAVSLTDPPITPHQAENFIEYEMESKCNALKILFPIPLNQNRCDALLSLTYEIGVTAIKKSTLRQVILINPNDIRVRSEWGKWIYSDGLSITGMISRRAKEIALWYK